MSVLKKMNLEIKANLLIENSIDYDFVHGDELIDEVLTERTEAQNSLYEIQKTIADIQVSNGFLLKVIR